MSDIDTILRQVEKVKHKIKDKLKIRISEDKYNAIDKFKLSDGLRQMLGMKVTIDVIPIKQKTEQKIKLLMLKINQEKVEKFPNKQTIDSLSNTMNSLLVQKTAEEKAKKIADDAEKAKRIKDIEIALAKEKAKKPK